VPTRLLPPLAIVGLGLLFFADLVLHPTQVLFSDYSDILAEHLPAKRFLVRCWQETGELPLWCPYRFGGDPFVHDIQVAAFYPPHWLLYLLPEEWVGVALSWLIVAHVIVAGLCMYAYARDQELGRPGALVAACGFMFAGKWLLHLLGGGHYIVIGLAWVPLVVLFLERAIRRGSFLDATWAGAAHGLVALGTHPQWTFYAGIFLALWTLGTALFGQQTRRRDEASPVPARGDPVSLSPCRRSSLAALARWFGFGAWAALLAAALAAVQFLPTLEAAEQSTRSTGVGIGDTLQGGVRALFSLAGPALTADPPNLMWEDRGGFAVLWLASAAMAPVLCRGRVRYQAGVCAVLLLFAFGGSALFRSLPGFALFRQHARMLLTATLPVAYLAGVTTHTLFTAPESPPAGRRCRRTLTGVLVAVALLVGGIALLRLLGHGDIRFHIYWLTLLVTVPAACWLLGDFRSARLRTHQLAWCTVLLVDLWALAWPLVAVRPEAQIYARSACVEYLAEHCQEHGRVLDWDVPDPGPHYGKVPLGSGTPLGAGAPQAMLCRLEALRGYNPLDNLRYKEYLQFITLSEKEKERPLHPFDGPLTFPVIGNFPIANKPLLDLLGVRYLVAPADRPPAQEGWQKVAEDEHPVGYDFIAGGMRELPPYTVYENTGALPRAFAVPHASPLPERSQVLAALKNTDLRDTVLLEDLEPRVDSAAPAGTSRSAAITTYLPNRVTVQVDGDAPGYLVLTDPWYPGWACTVDGAPARLFRADFLFRAVEVPPGPHQVVFSFAPVSYRWGRAISGGALLALAGFALLAAALPWLHRSSRSVGGKARFAGSRPDGQ
jgi:hypothetical protein